ncbi:MAG TPA: hypothetical protein VL069_05410 [Opitutus sp.]|nr:hypothetical protein [Opitutus sp.]
MLTLTAGRRMLALVLLFAFSTAAFAHPQPATLSFSTPALSGSFSVRIDSTTRALVDINSVSLTIDGHKFKSKEIGFRYVPGSNATYIAGLASGIDIVGSGAGPDFYLVWTPDNKGGYKAFISYTSGTQIVPGTEAKLTISDRKPEKN